MKKYIFISLLMIAFSLGVNSAAQAATYYVDSYGSDGNVGSEASPFKTIQKGVSVAIAGDTVIVNPGMYPEMVQTKNSGTASSPITIRALNSSVDPNTTTDQRSTVWGFTISHPYITVQGFDINGCGGGSNSAVTTNTLTTTVNSKPVTTSGDNFQFLDNTVRDGIWMASDDLIFKSSDVDGPSISSANGDFVASGFRPGISIQILTSNYAVITKNQVEQAGLLWNDVSAKLIANSWARSINPVTLVYTADLTEEKRRMWDCFGGDFPKILPVLQQAYNSMQQAYTTKNSSLTVLKVQSVSPHRLVLTSTSILQDEGPVYAYIVDAICGIRVNTNDCLIRGNHVRNLAYEYITIVGARNTIENNLIEDQNGWDCFRAWGHDNTFRRNITRLGVHIPGNPEHPDYIQTFANGGGESYNMLFEGNWIENDDSQMGIINTFTFPNDYSGTYHDYIFKDNVFVNVTMNMYLDLAGVQFINNTFYRCASAASGFAFGGSLQAGIPSQGVFRNNIFLECGHTAEEPGINGYSPTPYVGLSTAEILYYVTSDSATASGIFSNLVTNGYINSNTIIQAKTKALTAASQLVLSAAYESYRDAIYATLKKVSDADDLAKSTFSADFNYAAGAASASFIPKTGFSESNGINGGDPLFVDLKNAAGPDGIPFTDDDGLFLLPNSPLCGKGDAIYPSLIDAFRFDAYKIWRELIKDSYLTADGHLAGTFTALGSDFRSAFPAYGDTEFNKIREILLQPSAGDIGAFGHKTLTGPYAYIQAAKTSDYDPLTVNFSGAASYVPSGRTITSYLWDFGDGVTAAGAQAVHVFHQGDFTVTLTITDDLGQQSTAHKTVKVAHADYPNLYLYLKFDGDALDYSGKFANSQWTIGTGTYASGRLGSAASFDGTTTGPYVQVQHNNYLDGLAQISIAFWAKKNIASVANVMLQKFITYQISSTATGFSAYFFTSAGRADVSTSVGTNDTGWHHYVLTYNGSLIQLYFDGAAATGASASKAFTGTVAHHSDRAICVGKDPYGGSAFNGLMDDVRIYDRALTANEVKTLSLGQELPNSIYGDVSGDGTVSAYDAALAAQAAVGLITLTDTQKKAADVSGDGAVSAYDAALIVQKAVGLISKFPVEGS